MFSTLTNGSSGIRATGQLISNPSLWVRANDFYTGPAQVISRGEGDMIWNIDQASHVPRLSNSKTSISLSGIRGLGERYLANPALSSLSSQPLPTMIEDPDIFHPSLPSELIPKPSLTTNPTTGQSVLTFNTAIGRSYVRKPDIDRFQNVASMLNLLGGGFDYHNNPSLLAARLSFFADHNLQLNWLVRLEALAKRIQSGISNRFNVAGLLDYSKSLSTSTEQLSEVPSELPLEQSEHRIQRGNTAPYYTQGSQIVPQVRTERTDEYQATPDSREAQITQHNINTIPTSMNPLNAPPDEQQANAMEQKLDAQLTSPTLIRPSAGRISEAKQREEIDNGGVPSAPDFGSPMQLTPARPYSDRTMQSAQRAKDATKKAVDFVAELQAKQAERRKQILIPITPERRALPVNPLTAEIQADYARRQAAKQAKQSQDVYKGQGIARTSKVAALRQLHADIHAGEIQAGNNNHQLLLASQFKAHPRFKNMPIRHRIR